jgi:hypothetical protein
VYCEHRIKANDAKDIEPSAAVTQSFLAHGAFKQFVPRRVVPVQCYVAGALEANSATSDVVWELLQSTMHMDAKTGMKPSSGPPPLLTSEHQLDADDNA